MPHGKIVEYDGLDTGFGQRFRGVAADVSSPTCYQNLQLGLHSGQQSNILGLISPLSSLACTSHETGDRDSGVERRKQY
jgi:hypothetical protein